jgi:hypothetical protein
LEGGTKVICQDNGHPRPKSKRVRPQYKADRLPLSYLAQFCVTNRRRTTREDALICHLTPLHQLQKPVRLCVVTRLCSERMGFDSRQGKVHFQLATASSCPLGSRKHAILWVPWALSPVLRRPEREISH